MIEMRLETSLNDLEELILKNKNDVKKAKVDVERIEVILKDPILTAPVKILDDDIRFFSSLFKRKKDTKPKFRYPGLMTSKRSKQRRKSLLKYSIGGKSRSKSKENDPSLPKFSGRYQHRMMDSIAQERLERSRSRESYFNELEMEVMKKLSKRKRRKLPELRPEQYKEKFKGLVPANKIILDSSDNLRYEHNLTKSSKRKKNRLRKLTKSPIRNRQSLTERKSRAKSKLQEYFQTSVKNDRYKKYGTVSKRLMIEKRLRKRVARSRRGRSPQSRSMERKNRRRSKSPKRGNGSMMLKTRM